jgi:hypothetical protein
MSLIAEPSPCTECPIPPRVSAPEQQPPVVRPRWKTAAVLTLPLTLASAATTTVIADHQAVQAAAEMVMEPLGYVVAAQASLQGLYFVGKRVLSRFVPKQWQIHAVRLPDGTTAWAFGVGWKKWRIGRN